MTAQGSVGLGNLSEDSARDGRLRDYERRTTAAQLRRVMPSEIALPLPVRDCLPDAAQHDNDKSRQESLAPCGASRGGPADGHCRGH